MKNISSLPKILTFFILAFISAASAFAAGEIVQTADPINYWDAANHTVYVTNNGNQSVNVTIAIPSGFTWVSGGNPCTQSGSNIQCILAASATGTYIVQSPGTSAAEYQTNKFIITTNNSYTGNNVSMLRIQCSEIFHTLVEFGRGRGNYFYNSNSGAAGSGQTETGCAYLPSSSFVELNFLHKTYNIKQYFNVVANAYNASYTCTYPNDTIVRQHLDTSILRSSVWTVDFAIDEIGGSWERFGYIGMQFDSGDYAVGQNITINCTDIQYYLPAAGGNISCGEDSFTLEFRDREPFNATATASSTIYNGTQEVLITYTITNIEQYTASDVMIQIEAPQYAQFIGTRAELWGTAQDVYVLEASDFLPGESTSVTLVARFNTSTAPAMTSLNLTEGISIQYVTCWEYNAYNPAEYIQDLYAVGTGTVNMAQSSQITNFIDVLNQIYNLTVVINRTTTQINSTVNQIYNLSLIINNTVYRINATVTQINNTVTSIYADTQQILDLLNCNGTVDTPICNYVANINATVTQIWNLTNVINATTANIWNNVVYINNTVNAISGNVSIILNNTYTLMDLINCTNITAQWQNSTCNRLNRIENYSVQILNNITYIWGNYTAADILNAIGNISVNISSSQITEILTEIQRLRQFDEELVFLVTDAFNMQQRATDAASRGDMSTAMQELNNANSNLKAAADRIETLKQQETETGKWWMWLLVGTLVAVLSIYLFQRVPEDSEEPRIKQ